MEKGLDYHALNAMINLYDADGKMQVEKDQEAVHAYFLQHVNQNTVFFHSLEEKLDYLVKNDYYEQGVLEQYSFNFIKSLYKQAYVVKYRFATFLGAFKYFTSYTLKTFDGQRYLERFEDRVCMAALTLGRGDETLAKKLVDEIMGGRLQPATPTFLNCGKAQRGELVSCFLLRIEDNMESIGRSINSALQLSKRGGGVAFLLTNIREVGAPIKKIEGQSSGIVPIMKLLEDAFSYANQLGARQGAGAVYLNAHHPDILTFMDTKRENADEKIRIKSLSLGITIPDITFELAKRNEDMYLFSPYDVERIYGKPMSDISISEHYHDMVDNKEIRKQKINARDFFRTLAEVQFESGYPYIMFEDTVNRANPIAGRVNMSNLCVAPYSLLTTDKGEFPIVDLVDQTVNVWNGEEFSSVQVVKTGEGQKLLRVTLSDGRSLDCTEYHKWYLDNGEEVRTHELRVGDWLEPHKAPGDVTLRQGMVSSITLAAEASDTYCVSEPLRNKAMFNGILTGNCSEILQVNTPTEYNDDLSYREIGHDISCNLASMNIAKVMEHGHLAQTVSVAVRGLTAVSELTSIDSVPSIREGNNESHSIGLGQMNLHGFLARSKIHYGSDEGLDFTNMYFYTVLFHALSASCELAIERGHPFKGFEESTYASGEFFDKYLEPVWYPETERVVELFEQADIAIPTVEDWRQLKERIQTYGIYNSYLQAVPPTGSISYINNSTSSIHPIASPIEIRKEGKLGRVYYPAPYLSEETLPFYQDAYQIGYEKIIDTYAAATQHVDQGLSLTLFFPDYVTTRDLNKAQIYAWRKGIKTLYYIRMRQAALEGTEVEGCVSCTL